MHSCPHCSRTFAHSNALFSHAKAKHGMKAARLAVPDHPVVLRQAEFTRRDQERARRECDREPSMADLVIEASFNRAMGLPVDQDIAEMFDV